MRAHFLIAALVLISSCERPVSRSDAQAIAEDMADATVANDPRIDELKSEVSDLEQKIADLETATQDAKRRADEARDLADESCKPYGSQYGCGNDR